ncbi:MAG TPA: SCO family protein [Saprospiraceae bacterium]|nr:SCO family protein [Saprospiraceae bacterium]
MHRLSTSYNVVVAFLMAFIMIMPQAKAEEALGVFEKLDKFISKDFYFTNEKGEHVNLRQEIDKPTVIALVYYECPGICTPLLNGVAEVMNRSDMELGTDYQVFIISFSHKETPQLAAKKKKNYVELVGKGDTENGFHFFTGDSLTIAGFLDNVGYKVKFDGEEYIHPATLIVSTPHGKIARYLHGTYFLPFNLKMAVIEASQEKSGPTINKLMKFCFSYDPEGQTYVMNITRITGFIILTIALSILAYLIATNKRRKTIIIGN